MFNQKRNKRFKYKPRFQDSKETESKEELKTRWNQVRNNSNRKGNVLTSLPVLIVFLISLIVFIYILNGYLK